jgi:hemerythrin-like domain-containing protein
MSDVMTQLHEEHRNIARILDALERQLAIFQRGEQPDYDILSAIAEYFLGFPDQCHHPKEDLIFAKIREKDPALARKVEELENEHARISEHARELDEAVRNVLQEAEVPRDAFIDVAGRFLADQRRHMEMEEEHFFPLAETLLAAEDWAGIDARIAGETDPLFGGDAGEAYAALRDDILSWEAENGAAAR